MSDLEELIELSQVVAAQKERIVELEQLVRDLDALCSDRMPFTWNQGREGILLRERIKELGITREEEEDLVVEMHNVTSDPDEDDPYYVHPEDRPRGGPS
jgi:hypothetical protein